MEGAKERKREKGREGGKMWLTCESMLLVGVRTDLGSCL